MKRRINQFRRFTSFLNGHPLASRNIATSLGRFLFWQIISSVYKKPIPMRWIYPAKFFMQKGMHGLTGNYYAGLLDFEDMSFLLHFLREEDSFIDVGANMGAYTILASVVKKAFSVSIEPVPITFDSLKKNIILNNCINRVHLYNKGVSDTSGELQFSSTHDTINRVVKQATKDTISIEVVRLDDIIHLNNIALMKIDVEGYEWFVLNGSSKILSNRHLKAIIIELNGSGNRYGKRDEEIHKLLTEKGFHPYAYYPFKRLLKKLNNCNSSDNTIYLRDISLIEARIKKANPIAVFGALL